MNNEANNNSKVYVNTDDKHNTKLDENGKKKREKQFVARNSPLIDLCANSRDARSVYNICVTVFIMMITKNVLYDLLETGEIYLGFRYFLLSFTRLHNVILIWLLMQLVALCVFAGFRLWAKVRTSIASKSRVVHMLDCATLCSFLWLYMQLFRLPEMTRAYYDQPSASAAVIALEQVRMLMKIHAFVRSNVPRVLRYKPHSDDEKKDFTVPGLTKFVYYLFAPTFLYRDHYPRTLEIRWRFVFARLLEMLGLMYMQAFILEHFLLPTFNSWQHVSWARLASVVMATLLPGAALMYLAITILLHAWMNATAEVLTFADREFQQDWWNSNGVRSFYRKWNVVVHDYLYNYIYRDFYETIVPGNKFVANIAVFGLSAVVHDYILSVILGFFYPVLFIQFFVFGMSFAFVESTGIRFGNVFIWWSTSLGMGLQYPFYFMECYARNYCPKDDLTIMDYVVPRWWNCFEWKN